MRVESCGGEAEKGQGERVSDYSKRIYVPRTLCELCANAYGGCSWSEKNVQRPVEGWDAIRNDVLVAARKYSESYIVLDCPLFELEEHNRWAYEKFDREAVRKRYAKEDA